MTTEAGGIRSGCVCWCFFFSSRRRHTRLSCDWSSDVCSSDRSEEHTSELQSHDNLVRRIIRSEEHTSEIQSHDNLVCRLLLEKKTHQATIRYMAVQHATHRPAARRPSDL